MADSQQEVDGEAVEATDLEAAIAENPEAVADFIERLDAVNELLDVVDLGTSAMTDEMVVELSGTAETLAASADGIATDETVGLAESVGENGGELQEALDTLVDLQRSGTLDELAELGDVVSLGTSAMTDEMVRSLAGTGSSLGELADTAAQDDTRDGLTAMLNSVSAAEQAETVAIGPVGLMKAVRDPEIQHGLGYLLAIAKALGQQQSTDD
ncbi:uncharacterized protein YjgD (DUF1641 family) [Halohasta litchfieldiae]|jgi:uncharacterized protein YjgD (DUF1641 family)|uniref:Uncharacterized conserved protein YjgD, DUF1641 family n=1 Tax=Halohasta litchfieldiae TaxID=1073996 RepID=A0A1H6X3W6_9EURY|nr:DUF1641 domain-containing protein [Halohasta litchfieldiae]ATW89571.1 uncharacterized protein YjgD (DUF1641 family) [Halohasta litchfieldiae]SEJ22224.1 Uncharacterized conserved protein YjgD, DUF1641 family [Halohasta litchfieldiae]